MKTMTGRQRLLTVLDGGVPDRCPATVHQWQPWQLRHIMGVDDEIDAFTMTGLDAVIYPYNCFESRESPDWVVERQQRDRGDGTWEVEIRITTPEGVLSGLSILTDYTETDVEHLLKLPEDIYQLQKFLPVSVFHPGLLRERKQRLGNLGIFRASTNGPQGSPWQDACFWYGTENMIYSSFDDPVWTHEFMSILLEKKLEFYQKNIASNPGIFEMIETGGGAASNTVISPDMFREFCLPYDRKQHDALHQMDPDIRISYHTCGGVMRILDQIADNGCDISETLSPAGCGGDIRDGQDELFVKDTLGSKVGLMGGFNQIQVLTDGSEEEIAAEVDRCFAGYGRGGGFIMMCSDHFFHAPKENLVAYGRAAAERCRYS